MRKKSTVIHLKCHSFLSDLCILVTSHSSIQVMVADVFCVVFGGSSTCEEFFEPLYWHDSTEDFVLSFWVHTGLFRSEQFVQVLRKLKNMQIGKFQ